MRQALILITLLEKWSVLASCQSFDTEGCLGEDVRTHRCIYTHFFFHAWWTTHAFPVHTQTQLLLTRLPSLSCFCSVFFFSRLHNIKMIKEVEEAISEGATRALKSTEIEEEQESIEILFCNILYVVWYINLPPTLCRSKQILCLLLVVSPQQYFYLSCKTAIQIDEVQQHDIFCTSITLRGLATWVKSQQTITFPDISSPHSDRWWILPDKAFIIAENRECTKISSLFFYPPSTASLSKSRWTQLQEAEWLHAHRRKGKAVSPFRILTGNQKVYPHCRAAIMVQWAEGHIKRRQLFCASSDLILLNWERLQWKWAMMACHWRLAHFYHLSLSSMHQGSVVQDAPSRLMWQAVPQTL